MNFSSIENEEKYLKAQERIASAFEALVSVLEPDPKALEMPEPPLAQKLQEVEATAASIDRINQMREANPKMKEIIDASLKIQNVSLDMPSFVNKDSLKRE